MYFINLCLKSYAVHRML